MLSARLLRWKWLAFVRRNISRPVRGFCRNTARNFSSGWEKRKAPCAPPFAGPVVKRRSLTICPQTTASKSRKALRNFAPSRLRLRLLLRTWQRAARSRASAAFRRDLAHPAAACSRLFIAGSRGRHQAAPLLPRKPRSSSFLGHGGAILRQPTAASPEASGRLGLAQPSRSLSQSR